MVLQKVLFFEIAAGISATEEKTTKSSAIELNERIEWEEHIERKNTLLQLSKCHLTSSNFKNGLPPTVDENTNELQNDQTHKQNMRTLLRLFSHSHSIRSMCLCMVRACVHACTRIFANISFSSPFFLAPVIQVFFSNTETVSSLFHRGLQSNRNKEMDYNYSYDHHAYILWLELRFMCVTQQQRQQQQNYHSEKVVFIIKLQLKDKSDLCISRMDLFKDILWTHLLDLNKSGTAFLIQNVVDAKIFKEKEIYRNFILPMIDIHE